ncbi:MAG: SDR family NAD(P)-dependent oxidoreductase [Psychroflexus halocasei]|uniref:SDR family NAD(P)-dependent oxidoreductase n=1 Tax=Psychroflexus sp. S27 TaxID=1982757 RepID=UPI000C2B39CB|nr:SDR family oxidoreductase [Psychroflexus sp. S27]PJX21986.1 short-chain dehydrogenase [Psychroflexus sp. S27]
MKTVVITGTSRGIGYELVRLFADAGHYVFALSRNFQPIADLNLPHVESLACDLTDEKNLSEVVQHILDKKSKIDILINNAGQFLKQDFKDTVMKDVESVYKTNVFGVFGLTSHLIEHFSNPAHVVTISSMGGVQGSVKFPGLAAYSSSKAAVITLTELLAEEYKETGISFNVLALGAVQTEMLAAAFPGLEAPVSAHDMADYIFDFALKGHRYYNGKLLQVANSTP